MTDKTSTFHKRLNTAILDRNIKQSDLVQLTGMSKQKISQYVNGQFEAKQKGIYELAKALNVDEAWLMGYDVPMEKETESTASYEEYGIKPIAIQKLPLLGEIACGNPIFANEDRASYIVSGTEVKADFCLIAKGDSMIGARIYDGDIVFIQQQPTVNNGEVAVVIIGDEAVLKRVYYYPEQQKLILQSENPKFEPFVYIGDELNNIRILGKAVAFQSDII